MGDRSGHGRRAREILTDRAALIFIYPFIRLLTWEQTSGRTVRTTQLPRIRSANHESLARVRVRVVYSGWSDNSGLHLRPLPTFAPKSLQRSPAEASAFAAAVADRSSLRRPHRLLYATSIAAELNLARTCRLRTSRFRVRNCLSATVGHSSERLHTPSPVWSGGARRLGSPLGWPLGWYAPSASF